MVERALAHLGLCGQADRYFLPVSSALLVCGVASLLWSGQSLSPLSSYLTAPLMLLLGVVIGRWQATRVVGWLAPVLALMLGLAVLLVIRFYANAQAALGIQLVALAGLVALGHAADARSSPRAANLAILAVSVGLLGVLLAARSQAASLLVAPLGVLTAVAAFRRTGPPQRFVGTVGFLSVGLTAIAVISLGSLSRWPEAMNAGESLSSTRHSLWSDALSLWRENPIVGGGPGSFFAYSEAAQSAPHLYAAHSSILQVGSELGIVGAVMFLGMLMACTAVAAQGPRPQALIGVAAWSALGVHSMIDHLYEFPVVTLLAGVVLGWAGRPADEQPRPHASDSAPITS